MNPPRCPPGARARPGSCNFPQIYNFLPIYVPLNVINGSKDTANRFSRCPEHLFFHAGTAAVPSGRKTFTMCNPVAARLRAWCKRAFGYPATTVQHVFPVPACCTAASRQAGRKEGRKENAPHRPTAVSSRPYPAGGRFRISVVRLFRSLPFPYRTGKPERLPCSSFCRSAVSYRFRLP